MTVHCGNRHHDQAITKVHHHDTAADVRDCFTSQTVLPSIEEIGYTEAYEQPCCSICDAPGHGYPGGGPCPLEVNEIVAFEDNQDRMRALFAI